MNDTSKNKSLSQRGRVRRMTLCALLIAMSILFNHVLTVSTGFVRFNLSSLPVILAAILFGPIWGFAVGGLADIVGGIMAGYAINPMITLGAASVGGIAGLVWKYGTVLKNNTVRLGVSVLCGHLVGSIVINSLALRIFYGFAWSVLAVRVPNSLCLSVAEFAILRVLMANKAFMKAATSK